MKKKWYFLVVFVFYFFKTFFVPDATSFPGFNTESVPIKQNVLKFYQYYSIYLQKSIQKYYANTKTTAAGAFLTSKMKTINDDSLDGLIKNNTQENFSLIHNNNTKGFAEIVHEITHSSRFYFYTIPISLFVLIVLSAVFYEYFCGPHIGPGTMPTSESLINEGDMHLFLQHDHIVFSLTEESIDHNHQTQYIHDENNEELEMNGMKEMMATLYFIVVFAIILYIISQQSES